MTTLLFDDFGAAGADVDRTLWTTPQGDAGYLGRTAIRNPASTGDGAGRTAVSDGVAHLLLSTFNPTARVPGDSFWGSEIDSIQTFGLDGSTVGLSFAARVRAPLEMPPGIVTSLFAYNLTGPALHDEIDWELLSDFYRESQNPPQALLNRYANEPFGAGHEVTVNLPGYDWAFHTFEIQYFSDRIEWLIDAVVVDVETTHVPSGALGVRLNIWAPDPAFAQAYNAALQPTANRAANISYDYQVDWVRVESTTGVFSDSVYSLANYTLPANVKYLTLVGDSNLTGTGNGLDNILIGNAGNNSLIGGAGNDALDGGVGTDTAVFSGSANQYQISRGEASTSVSGVDGLDTLLGVERFRFEDKSIAYDISGNAGQAYRLYQAALDRSPDSEGLGDWIEYLDRGASLADAAAGFVSSPEFKALYGPNPASAELVTKFYNNVLDRAPEQAGFDYWMNQLNSGLQTVPVVLSNFSESPENQANLIGIIGDGFSYTPWHG